MDEQNRDEIKAALHRGTRTFMGLTLMVAPGALVFRTETELLGHEAVRLLRERGPNQTAIDVCCGGGNLGCAVAHHVDSATVFATDLTESCASLARKNVEQLGLAARVKVYQGDLFEPIRGSLPPGGVDAIICNPPYISTKKLETERGDLLAHEPREAFDGGPYGLSIHQRVVREAFELLKPGGHLLFEFGLGQERQLKAIFDRSKAYQDVRFVTNEEGAPRVAVATRPV